MNENNIVSSLSYRNNSIVINFNEDMNYPNLNSNSESFTHSYLNPKNYILIFNDKLYSLPLNTVVYEFNDHRSVRLTLPEYTIAGYKSLPSNLTVKVGHLSKNNIYFIESTNNKIQNPCISFTLYKDVEILSISNGSLEIIDSNSLNYTYRGENGFTYINNRDFYIILNNTKVYPLDVYIINPKTIKFIFAGNTFKDSFAFIQLYTISYEVGDTFSKDLYGYGIAQNSHIETNGIKTFSLVSTTNGVHATENKSSFKLLFNNPLAYFDKNDFKIYYNNILYIIDSFDLDMEKRIISFDCNFFTEDILSDYISIFTSVSYNNVGTVDVYGNKVYISSPLHCEVFSLKTGTFSFSYNTFKNSKLTLEFNSNFSPQSIIIDSKFDGTLIPWDGTPLYIEPGNIIVCPNNITLKFNPNFGQINIITKDNYTFINSTEYNKYPCTLYYIDNKKVSLIFNENEIINANCNAIKDINYKGSSDLINNDEDFLFSSPLSINLNLSNPYNILPIDYSWQNPFMGGNFYNNYIIFLSSNQQSNTYGSSTYPTLIDGNICFINNDYSSDLNIENIIANNITFSNKA